MKKASEMKKKERKKVWFVFPKNHLLQMWTNGRKSQSGNALGKKR